MNADQFQRLLEDLALAGGLADSSNLLEHGRLQIGPFDMVLEHAPEFDPDLLQVHVHLGSFDDGHRLALTTALLEANVIGGYAGLCVFGLVPGTSEVVMQMRVVLDDGMQAHDLWQELSDIARHGNTGWQALLDSAGAAVAPREAHYG